MSTMTREAPYSHDTYVLEQTGLQVGKFDYRTLLDYNKLIFDAYTHRPTRPDEVTTFLEDSCVGQGSVENLLRGLSEAKGGQKAQWVDMGAGMAVAMREAAHLGLGEYADMTSVDIRRLDPRTYRRQLIGKIGLSHLMEERYDPGFVRGNAETVRLPNPPDLITAIMVSQYLNNPLGALCNWYNQLADDGILVAATDHNWSSGIVQQEPLTDHAAVLGDKFIVPQLKQRGAQVAAVDFDGYDGYEFSCLAMQKVPGTQLQLNAPLLRTPTNWGPMEDGYKSAWYGQPPLGKPFVELIDAA